MMRYEIFFAAALITATCSAAPLELVPATGSPFRAGTTPVSLVVVDVDSDRALDIVVADSGSGNLIVLRGDGRGRFTESAQFAAMPEAHLLATGDFDGDRKPDLIVTSHDSNDAVILMNRNGKFPASKSVTLFEGARRHNHGLVVADVNKDGHADITAGHQDLDAIAILLGKGDGTFHPPQLTAVGRSPYPHIAADMDGDKRPDIVVPNVRGDSVTILRGRADGRLEPEPPIRLAARPYHVAAGQLDRDGEIDLVVTHDDSSTATILFGRERRVARLELGQRAGGVAIADLNGDSFADIALAGSGHVRLFMNDGRGAFRRERDFESDGWSVVLHDVNGDGHADVIFPDSERGTVSVFLSKTHEN